MATTRDLVPEVDAGPSEPEAEDGALAWWRTAAPWVSRLVVLACSVYVLAQLHPELLLRDTTTNGGDTGAHVWWPAFLRDHLLPSWRISGWAPDWYAGFPVGFFYFPLPALFVVLLDVLLPYNVAFKLVTAAGPVLLPPAAYALGRGLRAPRPAPALFAVAALVMLFFEGDPGTDPGSGTIAFNQRIMGGTLPSNLAGEFSFMLALVFALAFLGALAAALDTRRGLALPAALLAATVTSHIVVAAFAALGAVVLVAAHLLAQRRTRPVLTAATLVAGLAGGIALVAGPSGPVLVVAGAAVAVAVLAVVVHVVHDRGATLGPALAIGFVGLALTAVWTVPLLARFGYTTPMRYEKLTAYRTYLFPSYLWWAFLLAVVGVAVGVVLARRSTLVLLALTVSFGVWFAVWPEGHAWNLRFLPFWYLGVLLLAATGAAEVVRGAGALLGSAVVGASVAPAAAGSAARWWGSSDPPAEPAPETPVAADMRGPAEPSSGPGPDTPVAVGPTRAPSATRRLVSTATVAVLTVALAAGVMWQIDRTIDIVDHWAEWNYTGYEGRPAYPEYRRVIETMDSLPPGRALWEKAVENGSDTLNTYGSDFALMVLPYWTDGRIASMEGLYYDGAASTPYHFLMVAHLARNPPNTVRGLTYVPALSAFDHGVRQLQAFGVRYYMVQTQEAKALADTDPRLTLVAEVPDLDGQPPRGWWVYEVADAALVAPLPYEPVVLDGATTGDAWQEVAASWWEDPGAIDRPLAAGGPPSWVRAEPDRAADEPFRELPPVEVTDVVAGTDSVSFRVSRPGVPVVVRASYFPNWRVQGAEGPWRLTPNLMVVVPTAEQVVLEFGLTPIDWLGFAGTVLGMVGLVALLLWRRGAAAGRARLAAGGSADRTGGGGKGPGPARTLR